MPSAKSVLQGAFRKMGFHVSKRAPDSLKEHLRSFLALHKINCVIDVGAHYGEYGQLLRDIGFRGRIASFEPTAEAFRLLAVQASNDKNWLTFNLALGAETGELEINVTRNSVFNSFLRQTEFSHARFPEETDVTATERVKVEIVDNVLGDCVSGLAEPRIYLKLDTQGYDLEVIKGANEAIRQIIALQSEVSVQSLYVGMPSMIEALSAFRDLGFVVTGLYPVTRNPDLSVIEFDCVLCRAAQA